MAETTTIRGLDRYLYKQAKAQAAIDGKSIAQWFNEAMKEKLYKDKKMK